MASKSTSHQRAFPLYLTKRMDLKKRYYWLIRASGILLAFLVAGIVCQILKPGSFVTFYAELGRGCFDFSDLSVVIDLFITFSITLLISIILIPPFKMKFWNIGAEGQILIGCMACAGVARFTPKDWPNAVVLLLCLAVAMAASTVWAMVPALFRTFFKTNETLFTLMMNYIATIASSLAISIWVKNGSMAFGMLRTGHGTFPSILGNTGTLVIVFAVLIFVGMYFYINKSKHGYEVSVVGESISTARYIGIDDKKVTLRTMAITGALFGIVGFFIVCGVHRSFNSTIVGGKGFTGVLIAWLGHFNPFEVALFSFLSAILEQGTKTAASAVNISATQFSAICTGTFFFIIIACEFFSSYRVRIHHNKGKEATI